MVYKESVFKNNENEELLEANLKVAYSILLITFCDKDMQETLQLQSDYETKIKYKP